MDDEREILRELRRINGGIAIVVTILVAMFAMALWLAHCASSAEVEPTWYHWVAFLLSMLAGGIASGVFKR